MPKKKEVFNNKVVTALLKTYVARKKKELRVRKLQNEIIEKTLPLINAAISRKRMYKLRADLQQECVLKLIPALGKFDAVRGNAFTFFWTIICNTCLTHSERLSRASLSIDSDDHTRREADLGSQQLGPDMLHALMKISAEINHAALTAISGRTAPVRYIQKSIANGDLFLNRRNVILRLKKMGVKNDFITPLMEKAVAMVRAELYVHRKELQKLKSMSTFKLHLSRHEGEE